VITHAAPHHLNADAGLSSLRRTRGGDAWQARQESDRPVINLGLPAVGLPAALPASMCAAD